MTLSPEKVSDALELAITSLSTIAATGTNSERIESSKVLLEAVELYAVQHRKDELHTTVKPLLDTLVRNMSGLLSAEDPFCPAMQLDPCQSGSLIMSLTQQVNK